MFRLWAASVILLYPAWGYGQALLSPRVVALSFPSVASPVLYGLGVMQGGSRPGFIDTNPCSGPCLATFYPVKSSDNGQTWLPLYVFPAGTVQNVTSIAVDPTNPNVVYVATQMNRGGIWKSTNGGQSWAARANGLPAGTAIVESLTVAANNSQVVYAVVANTLYKSTDGAASWVTQSSLPGGYGQVALLPKTPTEGYWVVRGGAAYRSTDDGKTWTRRGVMALADEGSEPSAVPLCVTIDPSNSDVVYAGIGLDARFALPVSGFWRSGDGGASWAQVFALPIFPYANSAEGVLVDPRGGTLVHLRVGPGAIGGGTYARSTNRGLSFSLSEILSPMGLDPRSPNTIWGYHADRVSRDAGLTAVATNATFQPTFLRVTEPFTIQVEQGVAISQTLPISTAEEFDVSFSGTVTGTPWLTIPTQSATTQAGLKIGVSAVGLAQGTYDATVLLKSGQTVGDGAIPVRLVVAAPVPPGPTYGVTVIAGGGGGTPWPEGVPAVGATLPLLDLVTTDSSGRVYIAGANRVRRIESNGTLTAIAGNGGFTPGTSINGDGGPATNATFGVSLGGMAVDRQGRVYLSDTYADRIRVVENGIIRSEIIGAAVGPGIPTQPRGMDFAVNGDLYVATRFGIARMPAGEKRMELTTPSPGGSLGLRDVAVAADGTLYFSDSERHVIYKLAPGAPVQVIGGTGTAGFNGDGRATQVQLNGPSGVDLDAQGNVWVVDGGNNRLRVIGTDGFIRTVAGGGTGSLNRNVGGATDMSFSFMQDVTFDAQGNPLVTASSFLLRMSKDASPRPRTAAGSFVNAGSNLGKLSPGVLFSFYGSNLATSTAVASGAPWPTTLGGATVRINGTPVPLFYASPTQINGQVPYEQGVGLTRQASVTVNGLSSGEVNFPVSAASPGILVFGDNRAVAVNPSGAVNNDATPAKPGDVMVAYFTGTGLLDHAVPTGGAAPRDPLSRPALPSKVFVGETECAVLFLGLTPDYIGLAQANYRVPDLPPGNYPLTILIGTEISNGPVITVGPK